MHAHVNVCAPVCACIYWLEVTVKYPSWSLSTLFCDTLSQVNLEFDALARLARQESTYLRILNAGIKDVWTISSDFSVSAEDTNSYPHAFVANGFQEEPTFSGS